MLNDTPSSEPTENKDEDAPIQSPTQDTPSSSISKESEPASYKEVEIRTFLESRVRPVVDEESLLMLDYNKYFQYTPKKVVATPGDPEPLLKPIRKVLQIVKPKQDYLLRRGSKSDFTSKMILDYDEKQLLNDYDKLEDFGPEEYRRYSIMPAEEEEEEEEPVVEEEEEEPSEEGEEEPVSDEQPEPLLQDLDETIPRGFEDEDEMRESEFGVESEDEEEIPAEVEVEAEETEEEEIETPEAEAEEIEAPEVETEEMEAAEIEPEKLEPEAVESEEVIAEEIEPEELKPEEIRIRELEAPEIETEELEPPEEETTEIIEPPEDEIEELKPVLKKEPTLEELELQTAIEEIQPLSIDDQIKLHEFSSTSMEVLNLDEDNLEKEILQIESTQVEEESSEEDYFSLDEEDVTLATLLQKRIELSSLSDEEIRRGTVDSLTIIKEPTDPIHEGSVENISITMETDEPLKVSLSSKSQSRGSDPVERVDKSSIISPSPSYHDGYELKRTRKFILTKHRDSSTLTDRIDLQDISLETSSTHILDNLSQELEKEDLLLNITDRKVSFSSELNYSTIESSDSIDDLGLSTIFPDDTFLSSIRPDDESTRIITDSELPSSIHPDEVLFDDDLVSFSKKKDSFLLLEAEKKKLSDVQPMKICPCGCKLPIKPEPKLKTTCNRQTCKPKAIEGKPNAVEAKTKEPEPKTKEDPGKTKLPEPKSKPSTKSKFSFPLNIGKCNCFRGFKRK